MSTLLHGKPRSVGIGCAVYLGLFFVYMFVLNPLLLTMVVKNGAAHNFWSIAILIGGAVAVVGWASARTKARTASQSEEEAAAATQFWTQTMNDGLARATKALPHINDFERFILERFDCRPCPQCAELDMFVLQMTPNGRSFEVSCKHCQNKFRWKAVHPDTTDVSSAYRNLMQAFAGTAYRHTVSVPPDKFSVAGGRELIPEGVRQVVWRRDGGRCVRCGAEANLHFDHVIPVAKGGATTIENLQILCAPCNLSKGARI